MNDLSRAAPAGSAAVAFARYGAVFCDSQAALQKARALGLPRDARVLTNSPALLLSSDPYIESLRVRVSPSTWEAHWSGHREFQVRLQQALAQYLPRDVAPWVAGSALRSFTSLQRVLYSAACLTEADLREPRLVIELDLGQATLSDRFRGFWSTLLASNPDMAVWRCPVQHTSERALAGGDVPTVLQRFRLGGWRKVFYALCLGAGAVLPGWFRRGSVVVIGENELVRDAGQALIREGFRVLRANLAASADGGGTVIPAAGRDRFRALLLERWQPILLAPLAAALTEMWLKQVEADIGAFVALVPQLAGRLPGDTRAVLTNYPKGIQAAALARVLDERGVPFVSFQHGVAREIAAAHDLMEANLETTLAGWFVAYNGRADRLSARQPFARAPKRSVVAGLSSDHRAVGRAVRRSAKEPILFVSTALYRGYRQLRFDCWSDGDVAKDELALVEILERLPHRVAYKPYPALRYVDNDPVLARVKRASNVRVVGTDIDLRYIMSAYRVIVTSRATSTLGWCLLSGRPVIFIDPVDGYRMRADAQLALRSGGFVVDAANAGWQQELAELLSRPMAQIEADWRDRARQRAAFIAEFIDAGHPHPGKVAARWLVGEMNRLTSAAVSARAS